MATYYVNFSVNGKWHSTTGVSSYPSKELVENGGVIQEVLDSNAYKFIEAYKNQYEIDGTVNYKTVNYRYTIDD